MNTLRRLRIIAFLEGLSFLVLLFIAMPLKYLADMPLAVRIAGSAHGGLFLVFLAVLVLTSRERRWPVRRSLGGLAASLLPFGTFVLDRSLKEEMRELSNLANRQTPAAAAARIASSTPRTTAPGRGASPEAP